MPIVSAFYPNCILIENLIYTGYQYQMFFEQEIAQNAFLAIVLHWSRAGSSMTPMRLVRLKPQGPGLDRGPDRPVQRKFTK